MTPQIKQFTARITRTAGGHPRVRTFTITTGSVDRDRDTISPDGWHLDNYRRNPVVLWAHDARSLPIGKALDVRRTGAGLAADVEFAPREVYAFADTVLGLVDFGALQATSVGFDPIRWVRNEERRGIDFLEQELLEFSVVPVPANAEALQMAAKALGARFEPYRRWAGVGAPAGFRSLDDFYARTTPITLDEEDDMIVLDLDALRRENVMDLPVYDAVDTYQQRQRAERMLPAHRQRLNEVLARDAAFRYDQWRSRYGEAGSDRVTLAPDDMRAVLREVVTETVARAVGRRFRHLTGRLD